VRADAIRRCQCLAFAILEVIEVNAPLAGTGMTNETGRRRQPGANNTRNHFSKVFGLLMAVGPSEWDSNMQAPLAGSLADCFRPDFLQDLANLLRCFNHAVEADVFRVEVQQSVV